MFGSLGGPELVFIFVLALLLFGPRKLPEIGRTIGRALGELRKATGEFRSSLEKEVELETLRETGAQIRAAGRETANVVRETKAETRAMSNPDPGTSSDKTPGGEGPAEPTHGGDPEES